MSSASATMGAQVAEHDDHMWGSELTEESDLEDDGLKSVKRNLDDTDDENAGKAKRRKVASAPIEGKANIAEIATRVQSTAEGAAIWSKAMKKLSGTQKESVLQNPEAFKVWVWRHQLQWRFLPAQNSGKSREYDIPAADAVLTTVENAGHIDAQYLVMTRIGKVMHQISEIKEDLRGDAEYNFRERAKKLLVKWGV
ncbi:hypothetical protein B0H10DRAFT_2104623 [Mycena sp. CBHHK59/15]|nr:hypothetical protein B0H10DRAFT_2116497 [Mycena sp. CBHHK59/15]KAJ6562947.1 hypothetical protein B0H10DRAFT_2116512 [Mycena sp. CBHHK59/15]KAJ6573666.1 hypothetical protein B0H10DRAFT_2104623 [Mycena sp. CBHHK59/15]